MIHSDGFKIGVIGFGSISKRHRRNIKSLWPGSMIVATSSRENNGREKQQDTDYLAHGLDELVSLNPCFVIDASPSSYRNRSTVKLLRAGIPVLAEKPIASSLSLYNEIAVVAREKEVLIKVAYCLRFLKSASLVKKFLDNGALGDRIYNVFAGVGQYLPDWRAGDYRVTVSASKDLGGGALLELSHELDYLTWLFGDLELAYSHIRQSGELDLDVEDVVDLQLSSQANTVINLHLDFISKSAWRGCKIIGSEAILDWDIMTGRVSLKRNGQEPLMLSGGENERDIMYLDMLRAFYEAMHGRHDDRLCDLPQAARVLNLVSAAKSRTPFA